MPSALVLSNYRSQKPFALGVGRLLSLVIYLFSGTLAVGAGVSLWFPENNPTQPVWQYLFGVWGACLFFLRMRHFFVKLIYVDACVEDLWQEAALRYRVVVYFGNTGPECALEAVNDPWESYYGQVHVLSVALQTPLLPPLPTQVPQAAAPAPLQPPEVGAA